MMSTGGLSSIKGGPASPLLPAEDRAHTFKVLTEDSFKVIVFNLFGAEVVVKCAEHESPCNDRGCVMFSLSVMYYSAYKCVVVCLPPLCRS